MISAALYSIGIFVTVVCLGALAGLSSLIVVSWDGKLTSVETVWPFVWGALGACALPASLWLGSKRNA